MVWMSGTVGRGQDVTIVVRVVLGWSDGTAWYSSQFLLISFAIALCSALILVYIDMAAKPYLPKVLLCFLPPLLKAVHWWTLDSMESLEGFVCIEACIILHCIIVQCIPTLYGCIIVHSAYYVYTQYKNPQFTCVPLCIRCHCSETKGRVRALWVRSPPCLDGHRQGHQCVVRVDCGAGQTDGRRDSRVMAGRWSAQ